MENSATPGTRATLTYVAFHAVTTKHLNEERHRLNGYVTSGTENCVGESVAPRAP